MTKPTADFPDKRQDAQSAGYEFWRASDALTVAMKRLEAIIEADDLVWKIDKRFRYLLDNGWRMRSHLRLVAKVLEEKKTKAGKP